MKLVVVLLFAFAVALVHAENLTVQELIQKLAENNGVSVLENISPSLRQMVEEKQLKAIARILAMPDGKGNQESRSDNKQTRQQGCNLSLGLQCAATVSKCITPCKAFTQDPAPCIACLGESIGQCCPCLKKAFGDNLPC